MNLGALLADAATRGIERLDGQLLLLHSLGRPPSDRAWLLAHDTDHCPEPASADFHRLCTRRLDGEPVAYLVGEKEFHGLGLRVDRRVLVPRPDTETLVAWALERVGRTASPSILDLGTGSGAIALAIRKARPDAEVTASDASADALDVARDNATRLGLDVHFIKGDWLTGMGARFDLIVSNPPYIASGDVHLQALRHEPRGALTAGPDGMDDLCRIIQTAPAHLHDGGSLLLEHGHDQADAVRAMLALRGFVEIESRNDLAGIRRCSGGIWCAVK